MTPAVPPGGPDSALGRFRARGLQWPLLVACLLAIPVIAGGYLAWMATHDPTFAIESDYYRKAVAWDATMDQAAANTRLGWTLHARAVRQGANVVLVARLLDRNGQPLLPQSLHAEGFFVARAREVASADVAVTAGAPLSATLRLPHAGLHEIRWRARLGPDTFTTTQRIDLPL